MSKNINYDLVEEIKNSYNRGRSERREIIGNIDLLVKEIFNQCINIDQIGEASYKLGLSNSGSEFIIILNRKIMEKLCHKETLSKISLYGWNDLYPIFLKISDMFTNSFGIKCYVEAPYITLFLSDIQKIKIPEKTTNFLSGGPYRV